jgi:large subunit ribosomal protein L5
VDTELSESPPETEPAIEHPSKEEQPAEAVQDTEVSGEEVPQEEAPSEEVPIEESMEDTTTEEPEPEEPPDVKPRRREAPRARSMRDLKIGKVVVNISTGQSGEPLDRAMTILENLTGQRPCTRRAKQTIRTFGIRRNEPISCMVTLRGERAEEFLRKGLASVRNRINPRSFDRNGNFAFGIREHIDIPGQRYDPSLGITGMDVMVTVERPGYRVARRRRAKSRVGMSHRVTREESIEFISSRFGVEVGLPSE